MDPYRPIREELGRISGTLERGMARRSQGETARLGMELGHEARMTGLGMESTRLGLTEKKHGKEMELLGLKVGELKKNEEWLNSPTSFSLNLPQFQSVVGPAAMDKVTQLISGDAEIDEATGIVEVPTTNRNLLNNLGLLEKMSQGAKLQTAKDGKVHLVYSTGQTVDTGITAMLKEAPLTHAQKMEQFKAKEIFKTELKKDLTPSQQLNFNQEIYKEKKDINEAFEVEYPKPLRPLKAKELPKYNKQMQSWALAQTTNEYEKMKDYYTSVLGEKASEQINKKAMAAGRKLYRLSSKIENRDEKKAFLQELRNNSPDLYEMHKAIDRETIATEARKPTDKPTKEPLKKMTESELRKALYKKTGDRSVLFSTHEPLKKTKEFLGKVGRGALSLGNRPIDREGLSDYAKRKAGLR